MTKCIIQSVLRAETAGIYQNLEQELGKVSVPFKAIVGDKYPSEKNSGIVFFGRCNNGWDAYGKDGLYKEKKFSEVFFLKSQFFNLMYKVYYSFYYDEWMDYAVMNNVAKMVPQGWGNCSDSLWYKQYDKMKEIIQIENAVLSPKFTVLVLGNTKLSGWEQPLADLGYLNKMVDQIEWEGGSSSLFHYQDQFFILTDRPERRKLEPHANAICELINRTYSGDNSLY